MTESTVDIQLAEPCGELEVGGEIDYHSAGNLREQISQAFRKAPNLRLRLGGVEFIDSTGLSVLLDAVKTARSMGGGITLVDPTRQLLRVLTVSGFAPFFHIEEAAAPREDLQPPEELTDESLLVETFEAEGRPENIGALRKRVMKFAENLPFTRAEMDDIKLAVGEASCNALRYGCPTGKESVRVTCTRRGRRFSVEIRDWGPGFDPEALPDVSEGELSEGGRGIFFMRLLMDEVNFRIGDGTTVELVKNLPDSTGLVEN